MFSVERILRLFNIVSYLSIFIGGCVGTSELESNYDNITPLLVCIMAFSTTPILIYIEWVNIYKTRIEYIDMMRGIAFVVFGILLIGITRVTTGFGILAIVVGICNFFNRIFRDNNSDEQLMNS